MPNSNTQMIQKGKISSVEGEPDRNGDKTTARVLPCTADSLVTRPLTIPWYLRGEMGNPVSYTHLIDGREYIVNDWSEDMGVATIALGQTVTM